MTQRQLSLLPVNLFLLCFRMHRNFINSLSHVLPCTSISLRQIDKLESKHFTLAWYQNVFKLIMTGEAFGLP